MRESPIRSETRVLSNSLITTVETNNLIKKKAKSHVDVSPQSKHRRFASRCTQARRR